MQQALLPTAMGLGLLIAYMDSRPNWDDTGITALALFVCGAVYGALGPRRYCLWGLVIGMWIPLAGILTAGNFGSLLALVFSFVGACTGMAGRKTFSPT